MTKIQSGHHDIDATDSRQFVAFQLGSREYSIDIMAVREIRGWSQTTKIPKASETVLGVINLRGSILPIIDLRILFEMEPTKEQSSNVVIIIVADGRLFGLLVDGVSDILTVPTSQIQPTPSAENAGRRAAVVTELASMDGRLVGVMSLARLVEQSDLQAPTDTLLL
ncbi:MAG: chemotaxis protein CheW [Proteobacteria bacterium]|nr:chemotaxis protein CheW [Pseudomonadota bacterium]